MRDEPQTRFTLFPTPIGQCGIAWADERIVATQLPEASDPLTAKRVSIRASGAIEGTPPLFVEDAIAAIQSLLSGSRQDLTFIACDFTALDALQVKIYEATRRVQPGDTRTYGEIAAELGNRQLAQAVGQAMGRNPLPIIVPCHRILGANGKLTGFSAGGGKETKLRMLQIEGAPIGAENPLFGSLPLSLKPDRSR